MHDIGHLINKNACSSIELGIDAEHEEKAVEFLAPWFGDDVLFYKSDGRPFIKKNNLIGAVQNSLTGDFTIESFDISSLLSGKAHSTFYLYRDTDQFFNYIYFALFFLVILIIALSIYYWKIAQTYLLDEKTISISGSLLELKEIEQKLISMFCKKRNVSNSEIMALFHDTPS